MRAHAEILPVLTAAGVDLRTAGDLGHAGLTDTSPSHSSDRRTADAPSFNGSYIGPEQRASDRRARQLPIQMTFRPHFTAATDVARQPDNVSVRDDAGAKMRRTFRLFGLTAAVTLVLAAGCAHDAPAPSRAPSSGPAPSGWPFPSAPAVGDIVSTGLVIDGEELVLAMWGNGGQVLTVWRDTTTAALRRQPGDSGASWEPCNPDDRKGSFRVIQQVVTKDGRLLDVGVAAGDVGGVSVEHRGTRTSAGIAPWSKDQNLVMFWNIRKGSPVTLQTAEAERPAYIVTGKDGRQLDRRVFAPCLPPQPGA